MYVCMYYMNMAIQTIAFYEVQAYLETLFVPHSPLVLKT